MPALKLTTRICPGCGKSDTGKSRDLQTLYCSRECWRINRAGKYLRTGKSITCKVCNKKVYRRGDHIRRGSKYCSIRCRDIDKRSFKHTPRLCKTCGSLFVPCHKPQKCCSYRCSKLGVANPNFGVFGSLNHAWRGGLSPTRMQNGKGTRWTALSKSIRIRDKKCKLCGIQARLDVHHIVPVWQDSSLEFTESNLISLCRPCHWKTFRREQDWADELGRLVLEP